MSETDLQLLARYTRDRAEDAFAELVRRHLGLVYSAALRQVRSPQLAEEVAQSVFTDLVRNACKLKPDTILTAWLYQVTRRTAIDVVRREARRQLREQIATEMNVMNAQNELPHFAKCGNDSDWPDIEPLLDDAMSALDDTDRAAVLLRYFENKSLREVGATLGTSDDAAQKRVSRAVERLREFFAKRGVSVGASGLVVVLSANAVQAAPVGLAVTISSAAALAGTTIATTATATATKAIAMTTLQKALVTATVAVLAGAGIYETRQASQLHDQVQSLRQQQAPLAEKIELLSREREEATRQLAALREDNERLNRNATELLKLRGEVGMLKQKTTELSNQVARASNRYGLLPEQMPPIVSSGVPDTAKAYARLVKKLATGQPTPTEEFNLAKGWPYLEKRFSEPDEFGFFQSEYLAAMLELKDDDAKWKLRRILEKARDKEHAQGLRWARRSDEEIQRFNLNMDMDKIRQQWNELNQKTTEEISGLLSDTQRQTLMSNFRNVMDFDPRLKSSPEAVTNNPRFQNLKPEEIFNAFLPAQPGVRFVPAKPLESN